MEKRVLIIKLGYCETLVNEDGFTPSLGDVFRHTVLLHRYSNDLVTWLTTESAVPLLADNPYISELLIHNAASMAFLRTREFDEIVCIEKSPTICQFADTIKAGTRRGFGWDGEKIYVHPLAQSAADIANGKDHFLPIQALLYQMVGDYWRGEDYVLGYKPQYIPPYDVGFNYRVGSKWPTKSWPISNWIKLENMLERKGLTVSWQKGQDNLERYMDWINAGSLIITCDSLGMHLGLALGKQLIALFGPTPSNGIYMYGRGEIIKASGACGDAPCMKAECTKDSICMAEIGPDVVQKVALQLLAARSRNKQLGEQQKHLVLV
jgi:heptosyltransferase-2